VTGLQTLFPFLHGFPRDASDLRADIVAGFTVALVLIPQAMAYAELAGLPPWVGLYAALLPAVLAALWGSSQHIQTGPTAMRSLLTAAVLGPLAASGSPEYVALAAQLAFLVGVGWLLLAACKLTFVVNFLSRPVMEGFINAAAVIIATTQIVKMLALDTAAKGEYYVVALWRAVTCLHHGNGTALALGGISFLLILALKRASAKLPAGLIVIALSTGAVFLFGLWDPERIARPVAVVGSIPAGLPAAVNPIPGWSRFIDLLPGAVVIALLGFVETCSVAKAIAARSKQVLNLRQEMVGKGLAAAAAGFSGGMPVGGSLSRSILNYEIGSRTRLSAVFTGLFVMVFLLLFTRFLYYLPKATLAAIILAAVVKLVDVRKFAAFWRVSRADGAVAVVTFLATLLFAPHIDRGIYVGVLLSLALYLYRTMQPRAVVLGRREDGELRDADRYGLPVDEQLPVIRFDGRLYFANTAFFEETVLQVTARVPAAQHIAVSFAGVNAIDASGVEMLRELNERLRESGAQLCLFEIKKQVYDVIERAGLLACFGREHVTRTLQDLQSHARP